MTTYFIITLGWRPDPVIATFARHRVNPRDKLILVVPEFRDERSAEAIDAVHKYINTAMLYVDVELLELPADFKDAVLKVLSKIENCSSKGPVIINVSGGMRYVVLASYTAFLLSSKKNVVLDELSIEGKNMTIKLAIPPLVRLSPKDEEKKILNYLSRKEATLEEIESELEIPRSTAWRYLKRLTEFGIIDIAKAGKKNIYRLRSWLIE